MPKMVSETIGTGDQSWLASSHGIWNGRTETIDISAFTEATHYPDGYIPSGTPVALVSDKLVPYVATEGTVTGAGVLAGFVFTDSKVNGAEDFAVALLDHGRVNVANLPISFTPPAAEAKRANVTFVFVGV